MKKDKYGKLMCAGHENNDCDHLCPAYQEEMYRASFKCATCAVQFNFDEPDDKGMCRISKSCTCPKKKEASPQAFKHCKNKTFCGYNLGRGECGLCAHDKFMRKWEEYIKTDNISHIL